MEKLLEHKYSIALSCILLLAAFLRLFRVEEYITFLGDEGRDVLAVYHILHGNLTLLGPTSSVGGFFLGPIYYYFITPFLWLFQYDPVGPAYMIGLFGILTTFFVYKLGREFFDRTAGLIASLLFAMSPLVLQYSRSSWNPNLMPIFTLGALYTLYKALQKQSIRLFFFCGLLLGMLMQLHYLAVFVGAIIIVYDLCMRLIEKNGLLKKLNQSVVDGGFIFAGFIVGWSPFLAFEVRHGFLNFKSIIQFIFHSKDVQGGGNFFGTITDVMFRVFGRLLVNFPSNPSSLKDNLFVVDFFNQSFGVPLPLLSFLTLVIGFLCIGVLCYSLRVKAKKEKFAAYSLLLIWFFVGVFLFGFYKKSIYDYYFEFLFPLPFILFGAAFSFFWKKEIVYKIVALLLVSFLLLLYFPGYPFRAPPNNQVGQAKLIAQFVLDKTNDKPFNFALITGGNSDHAYRYFFEMWGRPPVIIQYPGIDPKRSSVTSQLMVICESIPCYPVGNSLWEIAGFGRADIAGHWNVSVGQVYRLIHYKGK